MVWPPFRYARADFLDQRFGFLSDQQRPDLVRRLANDFGLLLEFLFVRFKFRGVFAKRSQYYASLGRDHGLPGEIDLLSQLDFADRNVDRVMELFVESSGVIKAGIA